MAEIITCPYCDGSGEIHVYDDFQTVPCPDCQGKGTKEWTWEDEEYILSQQLLWALENNGFEED